MESCKKVEPSISELVYEPKLQVNGMYNITITIPINKPSTPQVKGIELSNLNGFIYIKKSDYHFWYQDLLSCQDDVLLYYSSSDDLENHDDIHDFIETNVIDDLEHQHFDIKSLRAVLSNNKLGEMLLKTRLSLEK